MGHLADGSAQHVVEVQETRKANRSRAARRRNEDTMRALYVDLEREWRGGQSQALLTLGGLRERGHEIQLPAARDSPLANRVSDAVVPHPQMPRFGLPGWAACAVPGLISPVGLELV